MNSLLGSVLAFNAGAVNAGGFLLVSMYTSHMTGFMSMVADNLVLGNFTLVLGAVGTMLAFTLGAATTAMPHEPPTSRPSSRARRRVISKESASLTAITSSTTEGS